MRTIWLLTLICCLNACRLDEQTLQGIWQAVAFFENGQNRDIDLSPVSLSFLPDAQYKYNGTGFYKEAGHYRVSMHYLFFTDTSHKPPIEHIVKVLYLSPDSLKIRMESDSLEQILWLARVKPGSPSGQ